MKLKKNELQELIGLGEKAISGKITEVSHELAKFRLELARGQTKNKRLGKVLRANLARLKTHTTLLKGKNK